MKTTDLEKINLRTIIEKVIANDRDWLNEKLIMWSDKATSWILNYKPGARNDFNRLVRGLIIRKPEPNFSGDVLSLIVSFPFIRFYNYGEAEAAPVEFANAEMLEKMDGTFVGVYFPNTHLDPHFHTRRMMSAHVPDTEMEMTTFTGVKVKFLPGIEKYVKALKFNEGDVGKTYMFEFIHSSSQVLTKYRPDQYGLYLLGARNVVTHEEFLEDELDTIAVRIGAKRPRRYSTVNEHDQIVELFKIASAETPDFEGFIFRCKSTGHRIKVKDPDYVRKHHMIDSSRFKHLIPMVLQGEAEEVISYFPHVRENVEKFKIAYKNYIDHVVSKVISYRDLKLTQKELALKVLGKSETSNITNPIEKDSFVTNSILKLARFEDNDYIKTQVESALKMMACGTDNNGNPSKLVGLLGLQDDEQEDLGEI